ncbi:hypothetical protein GOODEAATRI_026531 [Goodea atripinnis]|uniref:Uncharacterized protein n=1 Tax=Goodea atripinnis TaxID=208336 RepID=A0ABV0P7Z5_9TELE
MRNLVSYLLAIFDCKPPRHPFQCNEVTTASSAKISTQSFLRESTVIQRMTSSKHLDMQVKPVCHSHMLSDVWSFVVLLPVAVGPITHGDITNSWKSWAALCTWISW